MSGWIKLYRQIQDNPLYFSEPFTRSSAWIDLLLLANHKEAYFYKRGVKVDVKIGQIGYDIDTISKRWKWSRGKVERFLKTLENENQIVRQKSNVTTLISIVNYKEYQTDDKANSKPNSKANGQQTVKQTDTNKNDKNENNENKYRAFANLSLSFSEFEKLESEYDKTTIDMVLDSIENYKDNKKYKSLYLTAKNWLSKEPKKRSVVELDEWEQDFKLGDVMPNGATLTADVISHHEQTGLSYKRLAGL
jgi:hypothetical protein